MFRTWSFFIVTINETVNLFRNCLINLLSLSRTEIGFQILNILLANILIRKGRWSDYIAYNHKMLYIMI